MFYVITTENDKKHFNTLEELLEFIRLCPSSIREGWAGFHWGH